MNIEPWIVWWENLPDEIKAHYPEPESDEDIKKYYEEPAYWDTTLMYGIISF